MAGTNVLFTVIVILIYNAYTIDSISTANLEASLDEYINAVSCTRITDEYVNRIRLFTTIFFYDVTRR